MMQKLYIFMVVFGLTGCMGYSPLYKQISEDINNVSVGDISMAGLSIKAGERRVAQFVYQKLRRSFHGDAQAGYILNADITETNITLAVRRDATDQRLQLTLTAEIRLLDTEGKEIFEGSAKASAPYNVEDSPFGTDAGREQARSSAARTLATEITFRVVRFLKSTQKSQ